jgi:hypothetical protein
MRWHMLHAQVASGKSGSCSTAACRPWTVRMCARLRAGHAQQLRAAVQIINSRGPPAWWCAAAAVWGVNALLCGGMFLTQVERRFPLVYYRPRRFQVRGAWI